MFRLPVCPHCGTIYRYRDTGIARKNRDNTCYHCHRHFKAALLPGAVIEALILLPFCVGLNILLLTRMSQLNLIALFAATVLFILLYVLLMPFFFRFIKTEENHGQKTSITSSHSHKSSKNTKNLTNHQKTQQKNKKRRS